MRIVAGTFGGRTIKAPKKAITRPMTDRAREGVFNVLMSMGGIEDATAVDLFAGSGAVGIEALSRGAAFVTFVDHHIDAINTVKENLAPFGATNFKTSKGDVIGFVKNMSPVDVAFIDPPFAISDEEWSEILNNVKATTVVAESNRDISRLFPTTYPEVKKREYGDSVLLFARTARNDTHSDAPNDEEQ